MARQHASRFNRLEDRIALTAAVDLEKERAEALASEFDGCRAFTDYEDILDEVDAVLIAVPHHFHHATAKFVLEAGKHVLLEKPMADTEEACVDLVEAAARSKGVFMIAYVMRYHPLVLRMKELLDQKAYGDVFQMSIWTEQLTKFGPDHWAFLRPKPGRRGIHEPRVPLRGHPALVSRAASARRAPRNQPRHAVDGEGGHQQCRH